MFLTEYVRRFPVTPLDGVEIEGIRDILVRLGFVTAYVETVLPVEIVQTVDGGYEETVALCAALRPEQIQWVRAWLKQLGITGPGTVEIVGGEDGTQFSQPEEGGQAELRIAQMVTGLSEPLGSFTNWGFGFS